jgi:hypothetical protein
VDLKILAIGAFLQQVLLTHLDQPPEHQPWDIALRFWGDAINFPLFEFYNVFALDGVSDWVMEELELRRLYEQALATLDREQRGMIRQMEGHTRDRAYFLFLYNPIQLFVVNKAVEFVPYVNTHLYFVDTGVTEQHWSVRKQKAAVQQ